MNQFDLFSTKQKKTHLTIHDLETKLMATLDPSTFVLNPESAKIYAQITDLQNKCDHIWENGACIVCGKEETKE